MSPRQLTLATLAALALASLPPESAESKGQCPPPAEPVAESYPAHALSPYESLQQFDVVFLGEVVVPSRRCSLGFCAGIKLVAPIKGQPSADNLVQISRPSESSCAPSYFAAKGSRWVVFANQGTSKTGLRFIYAEDLGPSFPASAVPNFATLETRYRALRASLDQALDARYPEVDVRL